MASEHYASIVYLIKAGGHDSSALGLIRCLLEAVYKGLHVLHCSTENGVLAVADGKFVFPKVENISSELEAKFGVESLQNSGRTLGGILRLYPCWS
jgi:hypothetical protein